MNNATKVSISMSLSVLIRLDEIKSLRRRTRSFIINEVLTKHLEAEAPASDGKKPLKTTSTRKAGTR